MTRSLKFLPCLSVFIILTYRCYGEKNRLLLFLMDGFRWDYFDLPNLNLPGFNKIFSEGVRAEYMVSDMPTLSYPNYYSIMTGLHVENHGMVGNLMYDPRHKEQFYVGINSQSRHPHWWNDGEPLWVTAEKQNKTVYLYYWPGCEVKIRGVFPTFCKKYNILATPHVPQMRRAIKEGLALFKDDKADVVGIYLETPDKYGHKFGVNSPKLRHALKDIDRAMSDLLIQLKVSNLKDSVNVMIFSDHGMTNVSTSRVIPTNDVIDMEDVDVMLDSGPIVNIWPKPEKVDKVYNDLKRFDHPHMRVYKKQDIPDKWFFKKHTHVPPIFILADNGWYITTPQMKHIYSYFGSGKMRGHHGYDNIERDMRAIFVATGPDFQRNMTANHMANIELYQMMCHLLDIEAAPHNGTWSNVQAMLVHQTKSGSVKPPAQTPPIHIHKNHVFNDRAQVPAYEKHANVRRSNTTDKAADMTADMHSGHNNTHNVAVTLFYNIYLLVICAFVKRMISKFVCC